MLAFQTLPNLSCCIPAASLHPYSLRCRIRIVNQEICGHPQLRDLPFRVETKSVGVSGDNARPQRTGLFQVLIIQRFAKLEAT